MKKFTYEELVRYDDKFSCDKLDFYGEFSPLDTAGRKEYLKKYSDMYKAKYGEDFAYKKVCTEEEARKSEKELFPDSGESFTAYRRTLPNKFVGWSLYTPRADIKDETVVLSDNRRFPLPAAKYEFDYTIKKIIFSLNIGCEYQREMAEAVGPVATGRYVEFRRGCKEIFTLIITPDGTVSQKDGSREFYHYDFKTLGKIHFGKWCDFEISFGGEKCKLHFGGESFELNYTNREVPDTLYLGGGMQPVDTWRFKCRECFDADGCRKDLFIPERREAEEDEPIGNVTLPFALATEKNKDKALVLKRKFNIAGGKCTYISLESLDPCGEVYINGSLAAKTDTFESISADITELVNIGENELEILVFPRAPEVLYPWHKHFDYYNAWFCLGVKISESECRIEEPIKLITDKVSDTAVDFTVSLNAAESLSLSASPSYDISIKKSFPESGEYKLIGSGCLADGKFEESFSLPLEAWEINSAKLYTVRVRLYSEGREIWQGEAETGFRTIAQKDGEILLNGKKIILKGALNMQFLPPYEEVPKNHLCPETWQMIQQAESIKLLGGNCIRMHQLGYGTNDSRWTRILDRLGVLSIWTTRLIDSLENLKWRGAWQQKAAFTKQLNNVINSPSIIMWEGSNEAYADLATVDKMYDEFCDAVYNADKTRLICPVSHLYYGGGLYAVRHDAYYNDAGTLNESAEARESSYGWRDRNVVRSAHTYSLLLGYGEPWRQMSEQKWIWQDELFSSKEHAYIVSEFAVIGRQNPNTEEAKLFINKASYELPDEMAAFGFIFSDDEWELSQAYQALAAELSIRQLYRYGADGIIWCCLWGGANNASYLKPIIDFYGYKKQAFYVMAERFAPIVAFSDKPATLICEAYSFTPMLIDTEGGGTKRLSVEILSEDGRRVLRKDFTVNGEKSICPEITVPHLADGYYKIRYTAEEI